MIIEIALSMDRQATLLEIVELVNTGIIRTKTEEIKTGGIQMIGLIDLMKKS